MKTIYLIISFLLFPVLIFAGNYTVQISGNVFEEETQVPLDGYSVILSIDRTGSFNGYYAELQTNSNGFIFAAVEIPRDVAGGEVKVEITDANGQPLVFYETFSQEDPFVHFTIPVYDDSFAYCFADFSYQSNIANSYSYFFSDLSEGDGDEYFWDFGDGITSIEKNISHTYEFAGEYRVCHGFSKSDGSCTDTLCMVIVVDSTDNYECTVTFEAVYFSGLTAGFQAYTESPYSTVFNWDFGDGTSGTGDFVIHSFPEEGDYIVTVSGEDTYNCEDSFDLEISVSDTLEPCEAWFVSQPDTMNPFRFSFFDMSNGDIAFWYWDFGDGSTSEEQNPVHGYSLNGNYSVHLFVEDTVNNCTSEVTRTVVVNYNPECNADFSFELDSLSHRRNHYHFENLSTLDYPGEIKWDFGDGEQVVTWQTSHIYDSPGAYDVCLEISDQFGYCHETVCKSLETPQYRNIGGYLFNGDFPINNPVPEGDTAVAFLYRKLSDGLHLYDSIRFYEYGYYYFTWLLEGEYIIKAQLEQGCTHFDSFFPVYHPSMLKWGEAEYIHVATDIFDCNTSLVNIIDMQSGQGYISGNIVFPNNEYRNTKPVNILLYNSDQDALIYTVSDENGNFSFNDIPYGCYKVVAESTGDYSLPVEVCIDKNIPGNDDVEIELFYENPTGIGEHVSDIYKKIFLFPVPAQATLNISFESTQHNRALICVLNFTGQEVYSENVTVNEGLNRHSIPVEQLPSGIYVLKIITPDRDEAFVSKFLRD